MSERDDTRLIPTLAADTVLSQAEWDDANFWEALRRLPRPIPCCDNMAFCPWCGCDHRTVTFGRNSCTECARPFWFGIPDWVDGERPVTWVEFPFYELQALGGSAELLPKWSPNQRLKKLYAELNGLSGAGDETVH